MELIVSNSRSFTTYCVCLELRSLPSTGITRLQRTTNLSATPGRPACPSRASGWSSLTTPWASRVSCAFLVYMPPPLPGAASERIASLMYPDVSVFPIGLSGRLRIVLFEMLGVHSRCGLHTRAVTNRDTLIEGFSHFVTSMTAPIASGWSGCRVGLHPLESAACHGAYPQQTSLDNWRRGDAWNGVRRRSAGSSFIAAPIGQIDSCVTGLVKQDKLQSPAYRSGRGCSPPVPSGGSLAGPHAMREVVELANM